MKKVQARIRNREIAFSSPLLPNTGLSIENCSDFEKAKATILAHLKAKTGHDWEIEEVKALDSFSPFIAGIHF